MSVENSSQYGEQLARVEDLDSDLVCARGFHLDILEFEWLACTPAYGRFALDDLSCSFRHYSSDLDKGVKVSRAVAPSDSFFCKYILPWEYRGSAVRSAVRIRSIRAVSGCAISMSFQ